MKRKIDKEKNEWYTISELFQLYSSAMLSDNLPINTSFEEYLAGTSSKTSMKKEVK